MSADATASAVGLLTALRGAAAAWRDELLVGSITWVDEILRSYYRIYEFTDDPDCVLRVGLDQARASVSLSDGTNIQIGDPVGTLHFWNEHLPRYTEKGPNLGWACAMRDRVIGSLCSFAAYLENDATCRAIRAIRADTAIPARRGVAQIERVFQRYGFERVATDGSLFARLHGLGVCFVVWGLTRAFNPAALPRQPFLRDHYELWISSAALQKKYGHRRRQASISKAPRHGV